MFSHQNVRLFVIFRVLYNARAYYPILAIYFTDLGLTLDQFIQLNFVWAGAIFLLEVPSGAMADTLGRRKLLVIAAILMVIEMGILLVAPKDGGWILITLCILNRFLSGASEAAASGADEAIAFDTLPEEGRTEAWDEVLATTMRWQAGGFLLAMIAGGLLYDPSWFNSWSPNGWNISRETAHRLPIALVFLQSLACLITTLKLQETPVAGGKLVERSRAALKLTLGTAKKAFSNRRITIVLVGALLIDSVIRNFATMTSEYYRLIDIPEWSFGFIGALVGIGSWFVPAIATRINRRYSPLKVLAVIALVCVLGLAALAPTWHGWGILPAAILMSLLGFVSFTVSRFLHSVAESSQRATLLSVKGLVFNLGYGGYSIVFSLLVARMHQTMADDSGLQSALYWQVGLVGLTLAGFFVWALSRKKDLGISQAAVR